MEEFTAPAFKPAAPSKSAPSRQHPSSGLAGKASNNREDVVSPGAGTAGFDPSEADGNELGFADELPTASSVTNPGQDGARFGGGPPESSDELGFADELPAAASQSKSGQDGAHFGGNSSEQSDEEWLHIDEDLTTPDEDHPAKKVVLTSDYEFSGPCPLCGTRYVATDDQIGTTIRCPDCHSEFEIREPLPSARQPLRRASSSWDDDDGDFRLRESDDLASIDDLADVARPAEDPLGSLEDLDALDTDTVLPHGNSIRPMPTTTNWPREELGSEGNAVLAGAALKKAEAEIEEREAQEKGLPSNPLTNGVLSCFSDPSLFLRWVLFALAIQIELSAINGAIERAMIDDAAAQLISLMLCCFAFLFGIGTLLGGSVILLAITQDTASGRDRIESWPDANFMDWVFESFHVVCALFVSSLFLPLALIIFPVFLLATLETGLAVNPISGPVFRSLVLARATWIQFLLMSLGLAAVAILGASLRYVESAILNFISAAIVSGVLFLYFRLLGRLAWACQEAVADDDERRESESQVA